MATSARQYLRVQSANKNPIISPAKADRKWSWVRANHWGEYGGLPDKYKNQINAMGGFGSWYRNLGSWTTMQNGAIHWKVYDDSTVPAAYSTKSNSKSLGRVDAAQKSLEATQRTGKDALKISFNKSDTSLTGSPTSSFYSFDPSAFGNQELVSGLRRRRASFGELAINPSSAQVQVA